MTSDFLRHFLLGSLAFNYAVLFAWFLAFVFAKEWMRKLHRTWFDLSNTTFDAIHYGGMAVYKIGILLFNLAPFIALCVLRPGG